MGMYTKIFFKGKLKKKFIPAFVGGCFEDDKFWEGSVAGKTYWTKMVGVWFRCNNIEPHKEFEEMGLAHRSDEQFFGQWKLNHEGWLVFHSELKAYHQEVKKFKQLLIIMFDEVLEYRTIYEEYDNWYNELNNEEIKQ